MLQRVQGPFISFHDSVVCVCSTIQHDNAGGICRFVTRLVTL